MSQTRISPGRAGSSPTARCSLCPRYGGPRGQYESTYLRNVSIVLQRAHEMAETLNTFPTALVDVYVCANKQQIICAFTIKNPKARM